MRYCVLDGNTVTNIIEATPVLAEAQGWPAQEDNVAVGWVYKNGAFAPPLSPPEWWEGDVVTVRAEGKRRLVDWANARLRELQAAKGATEAEVAAAPLKLAAAKRVLADDTAGRDWGDPDAGGPWQADSEDIGALIAEAAYTGETVPELAQKAHDTITAFNDIASRFAGTRRAAFAAMDAAPDGAGVKAVLDAVHAQAEAEMAVAVPAVLQA